MKLFKTLAARVLLLMFVLLLKIPYLLNICLVPNKKNKVLKKISVVVMLKKESFTCKRGLCMFSSICHLK